MEAALGAVIGAHAGPGTVGLFWFADSDRRPT
jgi:fatty acid-binding protein DegV